MCNGTLVKLGEAFKMVIPSQALFKRREGVETRRRASNLDEGIVQVTNSNIVRGDENRGGKHNLEMSVQFGPPQQVK